LGTVNEYSPERLEFAVSRKHFLPDKNMPPYYLYGDVIIGEGTVIMPGVVIIGPVVIGKNCLIKPNTVIGAKGFSFGFEEDLTPHSIGHNGNVIIGDNVEIGALCTVCQATVKTTYIGDNVKIDDHIHIAHNCSIFEKTIITAGVTFGGGVIVGRECWIGLNATIQNKVELAERTLVGSGANVIRNSEAGDVLVGNPAKVLRKR